MNYKYKLALNNLRMANVIYEKNEKLYQENNNDLDVLEELIEKYDELTRLEEGFRGALVGNKRASVGAKFYYKLMIERDEALMRIEELEKNYVNACNNCHFRKDNEQIPFLLEENQKYYERILELEQKNNVLVDGARALKYGIFIYDDHLDLYDNLFTNEQEQYNKIKAMLELVEVRE